jgi:arabinan endo-1,5-alpha-L-arabinosidase
VGGAAGVGGVGGFGGDATADAGAPDDDRCDVAVLDPAAPPSALTLSGNLGTHDPALLEEDGVFHLVHTGPRLPGKTSTDLISWEGAPAALGSSNPSWIAMQVPGASDLWAPDLSVFGGQVHLYYSASTFGSNSSCIGHATRASFASGSFADQGAVICSNHGSDDDWNAIDPNVIVDREGTAWLAFGSFWSGIKAVRLDAQGARADDEVHALASRGGGAIEAPYIVRRCGFYYLFVSFDRCCDGTNSTYNIRVGRSSEVLGPYADRDGKPMLDGGGTLLVAGEGRWHGPGHNAVLFSGDRAYNVFHAYDGDAGGASRLRVAELAWDTEGWPVSGGP